MSLAPSMIVNPPVQPNHQGTVDDDAFEDAAAFGTGSALYRHGQDRGTAGSCRAVRAALAEWDPVVLAREGGDEESARR